MKLTLFLPRFVFCRQCGAFSAKIKFKSSLKNPQTRPPDTQMTNALQRLSGIAKQSERYTKIESLL